MRDAVLAVAGTLRTDRGGPPFEAFAFEKDHSPRYLYEQYDPMDASTYRRSVYRFIVRSVPDPMMEVLDGADPSRSVARRNVTITPLQALTLMNNPFMLAQAGHLAARLTKERRTTRERIERAYWLALGRAPAPGEQARLTDYAERHGLRAACRLLFNLNEFHFVD